MKKIAIIPARGGSKRIPRKNIKTFLGIPIIAYSIKAAQESGLFDEIMVSTDDEEIAAIAREYGANVPFLRSNKTADDYATLADVLNEVLNYYSNESIHFDLFCCILATAPFLPSSRLVESYNKLIDNNFDSVFPVLKFSYPIQRALHIVEDKLSMVQPEFKNSRSQDLPARYHDSGQFYWMKNDEFAKQQTLFASNSGAIVLNEWEVQDIDTEEDWKMAEIKYQILHHV